MPPLPMIGNPGGHFNQSLDQPLNRPLHFFTPTVELPYYVEEVLGQYAHL
jgi:hypothetical protein